MARRWAEVARKDQLWVQSRLANSAAWWHGLETDHAKGDAFLAAIAVLREAAKAPAPPSNAHTTDGYRPLTEVPICAHWPCRLENGHTGECKPKRPKPRKPRGRKVRT